MPAARALRLRAALLSGLLAWVPVRAQEGPTAGRLAGVQFEGGGEDDQRFAEAALGLKAGQPVTQEAFQRALAAVRLVDRYAAVEGSLGPDGIARVRLVPLSPLKAWHWEGDPVPKDLEKTLLPDLRVGQRIGPLRRAALASDAEQLFRDSGYPEAKVQALLQADGSELRLKLALGPPSLIREVRIEGEPGTYTRAALLKAAGLKPGKSFWTPTVLREAQHRLRQKLVSDDRLECFVRLGPSEAPGVLLMEVRPGPRVKLKANGLRALGTLYGRPSLSEFVPLARAERYSPSLLDEGAGRIATYFRNQGFPEARVDYQRVVTEGTEAKPEAVRITFNVVTGPRRSLGVVHVEGNRELTDADLQPAVTLPKRYFMLAPHAKAEVMKALEERVTTLYLERGFPDVVVRRRVDTAPDGTVDVRIIIREGQRRELLALELLLPDDPAFDRQSLAPSLLLALSEKPKAEKGTRRYPSDRHHLRGYEGTVEDLPNGARLVFKPALPFVRNDLALVLSDLRRRLSSLGAATPQVDLTYENDDARTTVRFTVPRQPLDRIRRVVVQGSDHTRASVVLREMGAEPGLPLNPLKLDEGQVHLGGLGSFQRVDLLTLKELPNQEKEPWQRGDLALHLQERSPWVFSESFGYDNTQGYFIGLNVQRLNVADMGRVVDLNIRAGDQTLDIPWLRELFPTGDTKRSVDSYSLGYTDPYFHPGTLEGWLADRTRFHTDAAYIEEAQASYFARRRRLTANLEWKITPIQTVQLGYRFERVDVAANEDSNGNPLLSDEDLFLIAKTPPKSIISAPYLQVVVDRRDRPADPTQGTYFLGRLELALQALGTSANSSFVKLDLRHQWNWPVGFQAEYGVVMAGARLGIARPTATTAEDLPLTERFFGGGPSTVRGVEPDMLGDISRTDSSGKPLEQIIPLGGQILAVVSLDYRFPFLGMQSVWAELFVDSGQVYRSINPAPRDPANPSNPSNPYNPNPAPFPPFRTTLGAGLVFKMGFPLKIEYAVDWKRLTGQPRTQDEIDTQLKSLLISAGFQF